jgi:hypothetical protein
MNASQSHIPKEVYFDFLGTTIPIHWDYHAILMVGIWFVLVPLCILSIRYGKPKPRPHGIMVEIRLSNIEWWWFSMHKFGFYVAIGLSLVGLTVALTVSRGFSGSVHSMFGILTVVFGCLQILSAWLRGKHGGRYYFTADPNDPATWRGDHYDMTPRRKRFEVGTLSRSSCGMVTMSKPLTSPVKFISSSSTTASGPGKPRSLA